MVSTGSSLTRLSFSCLMRLVTPLLLSTSVSWPFPLPICWLHIMHHAPCTMHHAPCTMHHASCALHPGTLHPAICLQPPRHSSWCWCGGPSSQLRGANNSAASLEGQSDPVRTPRRCGRCDKDQQFGREASGSGRHHNPSYSRSPTRQAPYAPAHPRSSPPPYKSPSKPSVFPPSTASQGLVVCALCLATNPHDTRKCCSETFWDGSKARCRKSDEGRLITPAGTTLCSDWNNRRGCTSSSHEQRHECSSCGGKDHGAQGCPRVQKKSSTHSL